jgi:hypothetical protein
MGFLKKLFGKDNKKEEEVVEEEVQSQSRQIDPNAPMYENTLVCNACGKVIENNPRYYNFNGRKMWFHKNCLKNLRKGNIKL